MELCSQCEVNQTHHRLQNQWVVRAVMAEQMEVVDSHFHHSELWEGLAGASLGSCYHVEKVVLHKNKGQLLGHTLSWTYLVVAHTLGTPQRIVCEVHWEGERVAVVDLVGSLQKERKVSLQVQVMGVAEAEVDERALAGEVFDIVDEVVLRK